MVPDKPMHVAIIDEELPFPMTSGKRLRTLNLVSRLADRHEITYICHRNEDDEELENAKQHFAELGIECIVVEQVAKSPFGALGFYAGLASNLLSPVPFSVQRHTSTALSSAVKELADRKPIDLWHCEWTPYAATLQSTQGNESKSIGPVVVMAHNVESLIWQRYYESESNPVKKWYIGEQWRKYRKFEQQVFAGVERVITVSDADADLAREKFGAERLAVVDNGVDVDFFVPSDEPAKADRILFLGSLDWRPNLDGVRVLLEQIFPEVIAQHPSAELWLVGRKPPSWLTKLVDAMPQVQLHADVPDVRPYMNQCGLMAVPLRIGGGSRLKILEAAAAGMPVVSTRVGAEGLHLDHETHYIQVEDVSQMADALVRCMQDENACQSMAARARELVLKRYSWDRLADRLDETWRECALEPAIAN